MMRRRTRHRAARRAWLLCLGAIACLASPLRAVTTEDVFRSVNQQVSEPVDISRFYPWLIAAVALVLMAILYNNFLNNKARPKRTNSNGKLLKEISRSVHLRKAEMKQLKLLAEDQNLSSPLLLLLCPSLLAKAARSTNPRLNRQVLQQVVHRVRQGLVDSSRKSG